jgi:translocation and assembly module TamA
VPPQPGVPVVELDPSTPLAESPEITVPWPDESLQMPEIVTLEPDPDLAEVFAADMAEPPPVVPEGDAERISKRLTLVFPPDAAAFPERKEFEERFQRMSSIENLKGEGDDSFAQLAVRARADRELLGQMLRVYGYYGGEVIQSISAIEPGSDKAKSHEAGKVQFEIIPGIRYRVGAIDLGQLAEAGTDAPRLRETFGVHTGDPLNSDTILAERVDLGEALGDSGYAFAVVADPELLIDHKRDEGDLTMPVAPKGKYVFGPVVSNLPRFMSSGHLEEIARFDRGDIFKRTRMEDLRRAILATGIVSSVMVVPREIKPPQAGQPGEVALDVTMSKAPLRTIAGALGYESGDGVRAEVSWEHRNLFPPEGSLRVRGIVGTKEQLAGVTFRRNNFKGRDQILTADLYADNVTRDAYEAQSVGFSATFEKQTTLLFQKPWVWSAGFSAVVTNEREGDVNGVQSPRRTFRIISLPLRAAYDGSDNLLDPTKGFRASLRVAPEQSWQNQGNARYARIQFDGSYYQPFGDRVVAAARIRLGSIPGAPIENIAPSRRFYAGGGGSVRGFGYQEIGPRDSVGDPSGGRALTEVSLEARIKTGFFGGALSVVPFIDGGAVDVETTPRLNDFRIGAGIGIRYATTFGPIRIDVATPLDRRPGENVVAVYVGLGQAF